MKFVIDLIEDLRNAIGNHPEFILGAVAVQKEPDSQGNALLAWGKGIVRASVNEANERLDLYVGDAAPMKTAMLIELLDSMPNEQMMFEIYLSRPDAPEQANAPLLGFSEDMNARQYMLLIEEA